MFTDDKIPHDHAQATADGSVQHFTAHAFRGWIHVDGQHINSGIAGRAGPGLVSCPPNPGDAMTAIARQLERHDDIFGCRAEQACFGFLQSGFQAGHAGEDDAGRPDRNLDTAVGIPGRKS